MERSRGSIPTSDMNLKSEKCPVKRRESAESRAIVKKDTFKSMNKKDNVSEN